jgi:hypothetical protein
MPIGDEAAQYRRLDHVVERHGVVVIDCAKCGGEGTLTMGVEVAGCDACDGTGAAFITAPGWDDPCGPDCPLKEALPT